MSFWRKVVSSRWLRWLAGGMLAIGLLGWLAWGIAVRCVELPPEMVERVTPSVCYYDFSGRLLHVERGYDYRWNFPIPLKELPPEMIRYVLAVEDRNFYRHHGFDFWAAFRATRQLLLNGHILSGASTITMQVMTMFTGRERTLRYKVRQILLACQWEKGHSKEETLEFYFNHLPFGGKIYGIEAAAQYYFGHSARELNRNEMILLSGLPQGPGKYRPDRYPVRAIQRRDVVLHLLIRNGVLTEAEATEIRHEPLRYRRFDMPYWPRQRDTHFFEMARKSAPGRREYPLALDSELQNAVLVALKRGQERLSGVKDAAAVVIENATGKIRSCVGTLNFADPVDGAVNAALAWRSPGSALKPFIYGEAIYGGMIVAETKLKDEKLLFDDYRPGNFDGVFRGEVPAQEALADSLNTPAVRLLQKVGVQRVLDLLNRQRLLRPGVVRQGERLGLSLAIGGTESNLVALTRGYARLAGASEGNPWLEDVGEGRGTQELWTPGVREMLLKMLRHRPIPGGGGLEAAWKTGTSNGNRDAWCFAVTPEWTVGVWMGNKSGAASPELIGAAAAAPVAAVILQLLHRETQPVWKSDGETLTQTVLCAKTGLAMGAECPEPMSGTTVTGIPLAVCQECRQGKLAPGLQKTRILSPQPGEYLANGRNANGVEIVRMVLRNQPAEVHLYVDGEYRGRHLSGDKVELLVGGHRLNVWGGDGWQPAEIFLQVKGGD